MFKAQFVVEVWVLALGSLPTMLAPPNKKSEFVFKRKFRNALPELPYDAKCIDIPVDPERFTRYQTTSLERLYKHPLHAPVDLGLRLDMVDPLNFDVSRHVVLDEADEKLLKPAAAPSESKSRLDPTRPSHAHFLKTTYIGGSAGTAPTRKRPVEVKERVQEPEDQLAAIERTFEEVQKDFMHPRRPGLRAQKVWMVLPDMDRANYTYNHVVFDENPIGRVNERRTASQLAAALLCSNDAPDGGDTTVSLLLPSVDTDAATAEGDYERVRDYAYDFTPENNAYVLSLYDEEERALLVSVDSRIGLRKPNARGAKRVRASGHAVVTARRQPLMDDEPAAAQT